MDSKVIDTSGILYWFHFPAAIAYLGRRSQNCSHHAAQHLNGKKL